MGIGTCYESPVTETPGLQGCLEDHATGTVQDMGPACRRHDPRRGRVVQAQKSLERAFPPLSGINPTVTIRLPRFSSLPQLLPPEAHQQSPLDHIALRGGEDWKGMSCTRAAITWEAVCISLEGFWTQERGAQQAGQPPLSCRRTGLQAVRFRRGPLWDLFGAPSFHLSHSPSDMGLPRSTLRWARVHVCARRQIHLYGKSKKSTHGHQTHLPARTHQRQMASGLSPRPHQPAAHGRKSLG